MNGDQGSNSLRSQILGQNEQSSNQLNLVSSKSIPHPDVHNPRKVIIGTDSPNNSFTTNKVRTSRYTLLTWAPKSLLWQFRRAANVYFLIISILTAMPFSPKNPFTMGSTFAAVLVFTMFKEAYQDYFRHLQDSSDNNLEVHLYQQSKKSFVNIKSKDLKVGDIVKVLEDEFLPADILLLAASSNKGIAFVNTMNLDGETNLKEKLAMISTQHLKDEDRIQRIKMQIWCEQPNVNMHRWDCNIMVNNDLWQPVGLKQLLMRGCVMKNTEYVIGVVLYTGHDTKVMLNSKDAPSKISNILRRMNKILYTVFAFQILICLVFAGLNVNWRENNVEDHDYLEIDQDTDAGDYFIQTLIFWVAYSHMIPISLYVALEVVKLAQAYLISQDIAMYYQKDNKPANARTSDLVEELGQVGFVFSDKTGTLTCNEMEFRKCSVNGEIFGHFDVDGEGFGGDTTAFQILKKPSHASYKGLNDYFLFLALCHSVFPTEDKKTNETLYQAPSPDELALVNAAAKIGIVFFERTEGTIGVRMQDGTENYWEILAEVPFESDRKRMTIVLKDKQGVIKIMTKGADQVMLTLLGDLNLDQVKQHIYKFAIEGLRTLVMAERVLNQSEFEPWFSNWRKIQLGQSADKERLLFAHIELLQKNLNLIGVSAIEDKLQDGVPETIDLLIRASIKVWVLTGDKEQTAIQIGKSCNLIGKNMKIIKLSSISPQLVYQKLDKYAKKYNLRNLSFSQIQDTKPILKKQLAIVVDGPTLTYITDFYQGRLKSLFFRLGFLSESCICCRVTPLQKSKVVSLAKQHGNWITLSIGDGANDVSMIQEAHIGVGIAGKEGTQAVQSSDFAFSQFRFLQSLLLVHGRWSYRRISWFICYYFYKNIVLVFAELCFALSNGFSGQIFFLDWLPMLYNSFWTSWPCLIAYCFEQDLNAEDSIKYPISYAAGQKGVYFTFKTFWKWVIYALIHGNICYWMCILVFDRHAVDDTGHDTDLWWISSLCFTIVIHMVTYKLFLESIYWTKLNLLIGVFSVLFYYASVIVLNTQAVSQVFQPEAPWLFFKILANLKAWIAILLIPILALVPDFLFKTAKQLYFPTPVQILMQRLNQFK